MNPLTNINIRTNPTTYFFHQSQNVSNEYAAEIEKLVSTLIDLKNCILCQEAYNFTNRIPRILIHCGHTFCTACLLQFYKNFRIRCPVCLKLIKNVEFIEQLPMNHTIMHALTNQENKLLQEAGKSTEEQINMAEILYSTFAQNNNQQGQQQLDLLINQVPQDMIKQFMDQQIQLREQELQVLTCKAQENANFVGPINDPSLILTQIQQQVTQQFLKQKVFEMEYCEYHYERFKHFHCIVHNIQCCRICCQTVHNKDECIIIDLYDNEDINYFLQQAALLNAYTEVFNKLTSSEDGQEKFQAIGGNQAPLQNNFMQKTVTMEQHNQQIQEQNALKQQFEDCVDFGQVPFQQQQWKVGENFQMNGEQDDDEDIYEDDDASDSDEAEEQELGQSLFELYDFIGQKNAKKHSL